jgi:flagellin
MTSIHTNTAALAALQTLRSLGDELNTTQRQVSSGQRVGVAADNVAYWSISTTMKSDNKAIGAVQDVLALSAAVVDTTYAAAETSIDLMSEIKSKLVTANESAADRNKINGDITELKKQLLATLEAASFSGENWLSWNNAEDSRDKEVISSFIRNSDGTVKLGKTIYEINTPPPRTDTNVQYFVDNGGSGEYGILSSEAFAVEAGSAKNYVIIPGATAPASAVEMSIDDTTTTDELADMLDTVEGMTKQMTNMAASLGALTTHIAMSSDFAAKLSDSIETGVSRLVDTDMEEASAKLSALQTQQQLATQSLTIANSYASNVITLFQ